MGKLKKKKILGDFHQWEKAVKTKGKMTEDIFDVIFQHYHKLHNKENALKYAVETAGKVEIAAGVKKKAGTYTVFEHEGIELMVPDFLMEKWVKTAKKLGFISVDIHDHVREYVEKFTDVEEEQGYTAFKEFVLALDAHVAGKAGLKVDPKSPVTFRTKLELKKDRIIFFSEKYEGQEIPVYLYYKWLYSLLSVGGTTPKIFSEMHKYAKTGAPKEPAIASFETGKRFVMSIAIDIEKEIPEEYPEYFANEMDGLLRGEIEKLAKIDVKPPKKEPGSIVQISKERVSIKLKGQELSVQIDPEMYYAVYYATVENKGKVPNWAKHKIYSYFMDIYFKEYGESADFDKVYAEKAFEMRDLLVPFFEYQVAKDAQAAKKFMEKEKKLKGVPKK
jgi:hypothetical protein